MSEFAQRVTPCPQQFRAALQAAAASGDAQALAFLSMFDSWLQRQAARGQDLVEDER